MTTIGSPDAPALVMGLRGGQRAWAESNTGRGGSGGGPQRRVDFRVIIPPILPLRLGTDAPTVLGSSIAAQGGKVQVTCVDEGGCTWSLP